MLSALENIPKSWCTPPCLPRGVQPLPGTLCRVFRTPSFHPRQCREFTSSSNSSCLTHSPFQPPIPRPVSHPSSPYCSSPSTHSDQALAQLPRLQEQQLLLWQLSGAPQPLPEREPCPGPSPSCAPTQASRRVTGTQRKQNPQLNTQIHPADPEMQLLTRAWAAQAEQKGQQETRGCCQLLRAGMGECNVPSGPVGSPRTVTLGQQDPTTCKHSHRLGCGAVSRARGGSRLEPGWTRWVPSLQGSFPAKAEITLQKQTAASVCSLARSCVPGEAAPGKEEQHFGHRGPFQDQRVPPGTSRASAAAAAPPP